LQTRCFATTGEENEMHRKHYSLSGVGRRSKVTCKTNTNHILEADVPKKMGGGDEAPQPVEHLLAALLGCTQATAVYVGRMMKPRLLIDKIDFEMEAYRDERGALSLPITELPPIPARLQRVTGSVVVYFKDGAQVSEEQLRILGQQTEARCPVANMMHASGCIMDLQWKNGANNII
jgi:putative redox protein